MSQVSPQAAAVYGSQIHVGFSRLLGLLDREPASRTFGSADREYWAWKFRDYPHAMAQYALVPLARAWSGSAPSQDLARNERLRSWLEGGLSHTLAAQRRNGAFDSIAPFTQDHGVTLAMVYVVTEVLRELGADLPAPLRDRACEAVRRACAFAARSAEDYAFISNHHALFALAWHNAAEVLGDRTLTGAGAAAEAAIVERQSPEGWYAEYGGCDPGYESLGIHYLAKVWERTGSASLLESLRRSIACFQYWVHPDGSVGGAYGSRHAQLYVPSGFEILAPVVPEAAAVARFMRERLARRNVVTPAASDAENLAVLTDGYAEAARACGDLPGGAVPCEGWDGLMSFPGAGLIAAGTRRYYAVMAASRGGMLRIFDRRRGRLAFEDAGYLVRAQGRLWSSQFLGLGRSSLAGLDAVSETTLAEVVQTLPTPWRFVVLRLLNLTAFRSLRLGAWIRRAVVRRLITARRPGPWRLVRRVGFGPEAVRVSDELSGPAGAPVTEVRLTRSFTAVHMGSAKYFVSADLDAVPAVDCAGCAASLGRSGTASRAFILRFDEAGVSLAPDST